jgi:hypothetical protein
MLSLVEGAGQARYTRKLILPDLPPAGAAGPVPAGTPVAPLAELVRDLRRDRDAR